MHSLPSGQSKSRLRKQVLLFGVSVLLPALVLLFFTIRMNRQDNELREGRAEEARQQKAQEIGKHLADLLNRAERTLQQEMESTPDWSKTIYRTSPDLVYAGKIVEGNLKMPWDETREEMSTSQADKSGELILQAHQAEFSLNDLRRAKTLLNQALSAAISPVQKSFVQLELGRVLFKSGDEEGARRIYSEILGQSIDLTNEYGIPFALYAADRLSLMKGKFNPILDRLEALMERNHLLPSFALYHIRDITEQIQGNTQESNHLEKIKILREAIANSLEYIESIQSLKPLVGSWILRRNSSEQVGDSLIWEAYGDMPLIVGINEESENQSPVLLAFNGPKILSTVIEEAGLDETFPGSCRVITDPNGGGIRPGGPFRGFWLRFDEMKVSDWSQSSLPFPIFYWLILFLVVGFTAFGGYLVWRDVSRELAIADMRSHFAASVSHELKTPLTAIRMFAEALTMGVHKRPEEQQEYLQTIVSESERLSRLLNNVLDFSKIEQGTRTYRFEPTSLEEIVHAAERALAFHLDQKGFNLRIELDEEIPPVKADRDALEQAVLNLLHNAMKYSGESRDIFLKLRREGDTARIDVIDFGIGISDVNRNHIFGKFFRVTGIENQRIPGTGLGLTIVSHIAKSHGGRIDVDSRPGEGSTFSIVLPLEAK